MAKIKIPVPETHKAKSAKVKAVRADGVGCRGPLKGARYSRKVEEEVARLPRLRSASAPEFLIPKASFSRLAVDELEKQAGGSGDKVKLSKDALKVLQWASEAHCSEHLARAGQAAAHAGRTTIDRRDFAFVDAFQKSLGKQ